MNTQTDTTPCHDTDLSQDLERLADLLVEQNLTMTTAESCTGGMIAAALTSRSGSSVYFHSATVSYSNDSKRLLLDVPARTLADHGAVSEPVVRAMAAGARRRSGSSVAVSVSGIAGPDGGSAEKPVGTVWMAWSFPDGHRDQLEAEKFIFEGDRGEVRQLAVLAAVRGTIARLELAKNLDD